MIKPSRRLNPVPPITAEHAAAMVVRGLIDKPARIDTPAGHPVRGWSLLRPPSCRGGCCISCILATRIRPRRAVTRRRGAAPSDSKGVAEQQSSRQPRRPARAAVTRVRVPGPVKRLVRLVPGVHW